tara:strand:+ start:7582 stop:7719 length:138 start_codon:yes stop_codon:yes gene_type:complete
MRLMFFRTRSMRAIAPLSGDIAVVDSLADVDFMTASHLQKLWSGQ